MQNRTYFAPAGVLQAGTTIRHLGQNWLIVGRQDFSSASAHVLVVFTAIRLDDEGYTTGSGGYPSEAYQRFPFHDETTLEVSAFYRHLPLSDLQEDMRAIEYDRWRRGEEPLRADLAPEVPNEA